METLAKRSLQDAARLLADLTHPDGVVHVGVGMGAGDMHCWRDWDIPNALLIDANEKRLKWAQRLAEATPGWHAEAAVLSEADQEVRLFEASNAAESGLVDPRQLAPLWPNLRAAGSSLIKSASLDSLLSRQQYARLRNCERPWLVIDCLPAARILKGAQHFLERCSAVWVRVLLESAGCEGAHLTDLDHLFDELGYTKLQVEEGNHPAVGEALFVRDWKSWYEARVTLLSDEATQAKATSISLRSEVSRLSERLEHETKANLELQRLLNALREQEDKLTASLRSLGEVRDSQDSAIADLKTEVQALVNANAGLQETHAQLAAALTASEELATQRQAQNVSLQQEIARLQSLSTEVDASNAALVNARDGLRVELAEARKAQEEIVTRHQAAFEAAAAERDKLIAALSTSEVHLEAAKTQIAELEQTCARLQIENEALIAVKDEQSGLLAERNRDLDRALAASAEQADHLAVSKQERDALVTTKASLEESCRKLEADVSALREERQSIKQTQAQLVAANSDLSRKLSEQEIQTERAHRLLEELAGQQEKHLALAIYRDSQIETLLAENASLKEAVTTASQAAADYQKSFVDAQEEHRKELAEMHTQLETARESNSELQRERDDLILRNAEYEKNCTELTVAVQQVKNECQNILQRQEQSAKDAISSHKAELKALSEQANVAKQAADALRLKLQEACDQCAVLRSENESIAAELREAVAKAAISHEQLIKAEAQIDLIQDLLLRDAQL